MTEPYRRRSKGFCVKYEPIGEVAVQCKEYADVVDIQRREVPGGCKRCNAAFWQDAVD